MSDRRADLLRQRELLREHLAWLEREIAAEPGSAAPAAGAEPRSAEAARPVPRAPDLDPPRPDVEAILAQYQPTVPVAAQTKAGCILYFVVALAVLAVLVTAFYFYLRTHQAS
jgi:hypothetical protein